MNHKVVKTRITSVLLLNLFLLLFFNRAQAQLVTIGTGTSVQSGSSAPNPYFTFYTTNHVQYLILASELNAVGVSGPRMLNSIAINISALAGGSTTCSGGTLTPDQIMGFSIKMKNTGVTTVTGLDVTGLTPVYSTPTLTFTTTGWLTHTFSTPFFWDGTSNVLVDFCHDNTSGTATTCYTTGPSFLYTTTTAATGHQIYVDGAGSYCNATTGTNTTSGSTIRPNFQIFHGPPPPMTLVSSTTTQTNTTPVANGSNNNQMIGMQMTVSGLGNPFKVKSFNISSNGSTTFSDITSAKVYYSGTSSSFSTSNLFGSVTPSGSTFTINGNQNLTTAGTHYFWLVYDVNSGATPNNILDAELQSINYDSMSVINTAIPTIQAPAGNRMVRPRLNGNYSIGTGGDFPTLTSVCNELSVVGASGPVILNLTNSVYSVATGETFPLNLTNVPNFCNSCNAFIPLITIRPSASSSGVLIENFAANAQPLLNLSNAPYVTIDGRPGSSGSSRFLMMSNGNTSNPVININNESKGVILSYSVIKSANSSTTSGAIAILGTNGLNGNDSILISNCNIRGYAMPSTLANAIFSQGQSATAQNDYVGIVGNNIYSFTTNGILATSTNTGIGSFWSINNNSFYDTATSVTTAAMTAINFIPAGTTSFSHSITGNYIGGSAPLCGGAPWTISSASGSLTGIAASTSAGVSPTYIQNNIIQNINLTGGAASTFALTGINTSGTGTYTIGGSAGTGNLIGHPSIVSSIRSLNNSVITGITNSGTGIINITNNTLANLTDSNTSTAAGIRGINNGSGSIVTISNNNLYNFVTQSTNTGTISAASLMGIYVASSGNPQIISGNTIGGSLGIFRNLQTGTHVMNGMVYAGASVNNTISNNTISNFTSGSTAAGTTSAAAMNGLLITSGSTLNTISGNTISNLTLSGAAANQVNGFCETGSSTTNNILNNTISNIRNNASTSASVNASAALSGMNMNVSTRHIVQNNIIDSLTYSGASTSQVVGLYLLGTTGNDISSNTITRLYTSSTSANSLNSSSIVGLNVAGSGLNQNISLNTLHTFVNTAVSANSNIVGIYHTASTSSVSNTSNISRNQIHSFRLTTTGAGAMTGMILSNCYSLVQNNMIRIGVNHAGTILTGPYANRGIYLTGSTYGSISGIGNGLRIYHNTIYLNGTYTTGTSVTYAIDVSAAISTGNVDIRNNILANLSSNSGATGLHYGLKLNTIANVNSNYNMFYTPGTGGNSAILSATAYAFLSGSTGWRAITKFDQNSASANPNFLNELGSSSSLSLRLQSPSPAEGMGDNTLTTSDNFDGASRSSRTPVDIGADAGNYTLSADLVAPGISFTPLTPVLTGANVSFQASVYDNGGIYTSGTLVPRVYYKKGINGTYVSTAGTINTGSSRNSQWNFTIDHSLVGGLVSNDSVFYYVIAQDSAGNIASSVPYALATDVNTVSTHPSNTILPALNFYKVVPILSSPVLVGPGNPITSLTAGDATGLFFLLNNSVINGNIDVYLTGNITETGITALNKFTQVNGNTLGDFGYRLTIQPQNNTQLTLVSTNASGMIRLNGASGVTFRGYSPSGSVADTNLVFVGQASAPVITLTADASNDSIINMVIRGRNTSTGLINILTSTSGNGNDNNVITGSTLYTDLGTPYAYGVYMAGTTGKENDNTVISNNNIYNFTTTGVLGSTATGINTQITNNHFYRNHPVALATAWTGINLSPGTVSNGDTISGNYIGGSDRFCGGTGLVNTGATTFIGISCSVGLTTGVNIENNTIQNINYTSATASTMNGITVTGGVARIVSNTIGHAATPNSIQSVGVGVFTGINYSGTGSVNISNNTLANLRVNNTTSTAAALRGITVSSTTLSVLIDNNILNSFYINTALTGTTTASPLCGIVVSSSNLTQTISNNIISNFTNANTTATSGSHFGIGTTAGVNNITNNQVRNFSIYTASTGTTTSASLLGIINTSSSAGQSISNNLVDTLINYNATTTRTFGIYAASGTGSSFTQNIIRNISTNSTSTSTTTSAAFIGFYYPSATSNINISGNKIYSVNSTNGTVSGVNLIGIYASISTAGSNFIQKNFIHSFGASTTGTASIFGIYQAAGTINTQNNMIRLGVNASGSGFTGPYNVYGLYLATSSATNYYHNTVYLAGNPSSGTSTTAGFYSITASGAVNFKNNIIVNNVNPLGSATGLNIAFSPYLASVYNSNYNLYYVAGGPYNYLIYHGSSLTGYNSLRGAGSWQSVNPVAPYDMNSVNGLPGFVNSDGPFDQVDLHVNNINAIEDGGDTTVALIVTDDFDSETRTSYSPTDVGADAGNFTVNTSLDFFTPIISYSPLLNTASIANRVLTANIIDNVGVSNGGSAPVLYYRKGINGTYNTSSGNLVSGSSINGVWSFDLISNNLSGLSVGDTVFYFVAAQDDASNVAIFPNYGYGTSSNSIVTYPANPSSYLISQPLPTVINVGPGYSTTSLTANDTSGVFYRINNGFLQGNTTIYIQGDTLVESGLVTLNKWLEVSGSTIGTYNYSLTIKPGNGGTVARKLITGNVAQPLIRFNNAGNISITGIADGGLDNDTNLVVRNTTTLSVSNFQLINDASNITFENVINEGRSTLGALVSIGTSNRVSGNDNISFTNCYFRGDTITSGTLSGISCSGTVGKENDNIRVIGCTFENLFNTCITFTAGTGNNIVVKNNHAFWNRPFPSTSTVLCFNLNVGATTNGDTISGNYLGGSGRFCSGAPWNTTGVVAPIQTNVGVSTGCYIQGNTIQNFTTTGQFIGMNCVTGGVLNIVDNVIGHQTQPNSIVTTANALNTGLVIGTPGNVSVTGNTIANIFANNIGATNAIRGIAVSGGSVNTTVISNNTILNLTTNSSSGSTTTSAALQGITISSSSSNQLISGNTITNLTNTNTTTANLSGAYGILTLSGTNTITGNTINGISNPSMYTGNLGSNLMCAVTGLTTLSGGGANNISNNTITNLQNLPPTAASTQVVGMGVLVGSNTVCNGNTITNLNSNSISTGLTSASALVGLEYTAGGSNNSFTNNTIHSLQLLTSALPVANSMIGFYYNNSTAGNNTVSRNIIHSFRNATAGPGLVVGLFNNAGTTTFSNNMIRVGIDSNGSAYSSQLEVRGIYNLPNSVNHYYHNTVYVGGSPGSGGSNTYAFYSLPQYTGSNILNIRNNIFYNAASRTGSAAGLNYAMKIFDSLNVVSNNNIYAATGTGGMLIGTAGNYNSLRGLGGFNYTTGLDYNSATASAPFFLNASGAASATNLRLTSSNPAEGNGDLSISNSVGVDVDGNSRLTGMPDIGASIGAYTASPDIFAPVISFSALGNTGDNIGPRSFAGVSISDQNGLPLSGTNSPRVYYKKGANGTYVSVGSSSSTGTATNASFNFSLDYSLISGGVSANDTIYYYVLAQDNDGNIISNSPFAVANDVNTVLAHPRSAGFYQIFPSLSANTVIYAGVGQTYPTLTGVGGVFELLNNRSIDGDIEVRITSNIVEPGFVALNQIGENGTGGYSVTIRPDSLTTGERVLTGSGSIFGLIILNGADRVKFTGVPAVIGSAGDKKLRIRNSSASVSTIYFMNDATGCKLNNIIVEGASNSTTSGVVHLGFTTGVLGNINDTISGCVIRNDQTQVLPAGVPSNAIYSSSTLTAMNRNNVITGNEIANFNTNGVLVDLINGGGWNISSNSIFNNLSVPSTSSTQNAISIQSGIFSNGNTINGNYIGGSEALCGGTPYINRSTALTFNGILLNNGTSSTNSVNGNVIQNIRMDGGSSANFNGISLTFGKFDITNNQIGKADNNSSLFSLGSGTFNGILNNSTDIVNVSSNNVQGITINSGASTTFNGISIQTGICTISNNLIGHASNAGNINFHSSGSFNGIFVNTAFTIAPNTTVSNNRVANINATLNSNYTVSGISFQGSSIAQITGNFVHAISSNSNLSSSNNAEAVIGINYSSASPAGAIISDNSVYSLTAANAGSNAITTASGFYLSAATNPLIARNKIYDIRNLSTSTNTLPPPVASGINIATPGVGLTMVNNQIVLGMNQTTNTEFIGIWQQFSGSFTISAISNSVVISGSASSGSLPSYAYLRGSNSTTEITSPSNLVNNAFINNRTGGTGKHYALANQVALPTIVTGTNWNPSSSRYNLLVSANAATLALWGASDKDINGWRTSATSDNLSYSVTAGTGTGELNVSNLFADLTNCDLSILTSNAESWYLNGKGIAGQTSSDFNNTSRGMTAGFGTDIGAFEFNSSSTPPSCTIQGAIGTGNTQTILFANREVGQVTWVSGSYPSSINVKYYTGVNHPNYNPAYTYLNSYVDMSASGGSNYNYQLSLSYDDALLGTMATEAALNLSRLTNGNNWDAVSAFSSVNTISNKIVNTNNLTSFGIFGASNQCVVTPVISGLSEVCGGNILTYSVPANSNRTYIWTVDKGSITAGQGTASVTIKWDASGNGSIMVLDSANNSTCKAISETYAVIINPNPTPLISGITSICENNSTTYSSPLNAARYYIWNVNGGTIASGQGTDAINVLWGAAGNGTLSLLDSNTITGCKTTTDDYQVTLNAYPTPVISGTTELCENTSALYSITNNTGRTYTWSVSGGSIQNGQGTNSIEVAWAVGGVGSVEVIDSVNSTGCKTTTAPYNVTINSVISNNTITSDQTICTGTSPLSLNGSNPNGGNGTYTYTWESSTTSATTGYTAASGVNSTGSYNPASLTETTWFRRTVSAGSCPAVRSLAVQITVNPVISNNTISGAQTICTGSIPTTLGGSVAVGGNGTISYLWESSTTDASSGFAAASGVNSGADYTPGTLTSTTWYRRVVSAGVCPSNTSTAIEVTVNPLITNNIIGSPNQVCIGTPTPIISGSTPDGGNGAFTYLWESSTAGSNAGFAAASGINTAADYDPGVLTQTTWFRRIVSAGVCSAVTSTSVEATVNPYPTPAISGVNSICERNAATYSTPVNSGRSYLWTAIGGTILNGQGTPNITVNWGDAGTGTLTVSDSVNATGCKTLTTPYSVVLNAYPTPVISGSSTVCANSSTSFSIPFNAGRTYFWTVSGGTIASGQGTASISINWAGVGLGTIIVSDSVNTTGCKTTTNAFNVNINNSPSPFITGSNSICQNQTAVYTTPANAGSAFIWNVSGGTISSGLGTNSITVQWTTLGNGSVIVTDSILAGGCKTTTPAYTVAVNPYPTPVISGTNLVCINTSNTYSTPANAGRTYVWNVSGGTITSGAGTNSVTVLWNTSGTGTLSVSDSVNATGCKTISSTYNVTVNPAIANNTATGAQTICAGTSATTLNGSTPTGGNGTFTYLWESSTTNASTGFAAASGTNNTINYNTGNLSVTTWYRRVVSAGVCSSNTSAAIQVTVNPVIASNTVSGVQTICHNTVPTALTGTTPSGGNGTFTYLWESSTTSASSGFAPASGTNNTINYTPGSLAVSTWYRRTVSAGVCTPNVSSAIKVTVEDVTRPVVLVQNITRYLNASGTVTIAVADVDNGSTDNCGISSRVLSKTSFNCSNVGTNSVRLVVTDLIGNKDSATAIVTIADTTKPTVITKNYTAYLDATGNATVAVSNIDNGSNDNCGIQTNVLSKTSFNCTNIGSNTVSLIVTDVNGNGKSANATVTVLDTIKPTVNIVSGLVLYLNAGGSIPVTTAMMNNGSTDNCGISTMSVSPSTINCSHIGITPVTLTITDVNGNVNSAVSNVVVFDPVVPVARPKARLTVYLSNLGQAVINASMVDSASSDNCTLTSKSLSQTTFNCSFLGVNNVSFTVQDQSGNSNAANVIVTVLDTVKPVVQTQNRTIYLNAAGTATISPAIVNNGSTDNCSITNMTLNTSSFTCANIGSNNVTLTITDGSSNSSNATATVTVLDTIKPVMRPKANLLAYLSASGNVSITVANADSASTDNCSISNKALSTSTFTCANVGSNSVVLSGVDASGNVATQTFTVTVIDTIKPVAIAQNLNLYLDASGNGSITAAQVNNGSSDNCSVSNLSISKSTFNCTNLGVNNITLTASDASANFRTAAAVITVIDTIKPVLGYNSSVTLYLNSGGTATLTTAMVNNGSSDNCSLGTLSLSKTTFNGTNLGSNAVTFTVADASSNSRNVNINVTVLDTMKPTAIAQNRTIYLDGSGNASITAATVNNGSTDNVGVTTLSLSKTTFNCSNIGSNNVTLTVSDVSGNTAIANAVITVLDTIKPIAIAQNMSIYLDANGNTSITAAQVNNGSSDNCSISSLTLSKTAFNCTNVGLNSVTLTATDASSNFRTATASITVLDTIKPTVVYNNAVTLYLNASGNATLTNAMVNNGSSDNCGLGVLTLSKTSFTGADLGLNNVSFTVNDVNSNSRLVSVSVTVLDTMKPSAIAQNRTIYLDGTGNATVTAALVNNGSSDNVGITTLSLSKTNFNCSNTGSNSVVLTVSDISGNTATANAIITVLDTIKPIATAQNLNVYLDASGNASITAAQVNNGSSDNCGINNLSISKTSFNCTNLGSNNITLTATDASSNFRTVGAQITVSDTIKPTVVFNNNLNVYLNASGTATLTTAMVNNGSTDNCSIASLLLSKTSFTGSDRGLNVVTFTVTDNSSNSKAVSVNIIVIDTVRPIAIAQNINAYLNASGITNITAAQVNNSSTDNVGVTGLSLNQTTFNCTDLGANTVTLTVGDASGNSSTANATVTVLDTIKPVAIGQNLTIQLNQLGVASIVASQVNNGSNDNCSVANLSLSKSNFDCSNLGTNNVVLTVADASGNFRTANVVITVQDTFKPVPSINNNLNLYLNASGTATLTTAMVNNGSSDNCGISSMTLSKTSFNGFDRGLNVVTFTVFDNSSNSKSVNVNVIVIDTIRPIAIGQNRTVYLNSSGTATVSALQVNNGSTDNVAVTSLVLSQTAFDCNDIGTVNVNFTVGDASGNNTIVPVVITVMDTIKPTATAQNLTIYMNQFGTASITPAQANNGSTDNCGVSNYSLSKANFDCSNLGANSVGLTVTDGSNNSTVANFTVTVLDTIKPFVSVTNNFSIYLDASGNATLSANDVDNGSYDNCTIASRTLSKTSFNATNLGSNQVSFTVNDGSSNSKTVVLNVFVRDSMLPILKAKNLTVYLSASGTVSVTPAMVDDGSSDNAGIKTMTLSKLNYNCSNTGPNSVLFTIRDASGNESMADVTITVLDSIKPVLASAPTNKVLGYCSAVQTFALPTATDNCGSVTVKQTAGLPSGSSFPVGLTTNTFELSDESGNKINTSFTITILPEVVIDTFPAVEMCMNSPKVDLSQGAVNMTFSGPGILKDKITFDPMLSGAGSHNIIASFLDVNGCVSTGTVNITVYPIPDKPEIVRVASNILAAQKEYYAYQWYRNNQPIAGATSRNYTATQSGVYGLVVRNQSGCVNGSDPFALGVALGAGNLMKDEDLFKVYPNPSTGIFYIELQGLNLKETKITMIDMLGKEVKSFDAERDFIEMNVADFAPGTYYVKLESGNKFMVKPIVIAK